MIGNITSAQFIKIFVSFRDTQKIKLQNLTRSMNVFTELTEKINVAAVLKVSTNEHLN